MDPEIEDEKEEDNLEDLKNEQKSLLIILGSLVGISFVVILGIFIFFPFNSSSEPAIIVEKQNNKVPPSPALEENNYITSLNQNNKPSSLPPNQEEFFLDISPEGISTPLATLPQGPDTSKDPLKIEEPKVSSPIPAKVSKPEEPSKIASNTVETKKENPTVQEKPKVSEASKVSEKPAPIKNIFWIQIGSYSDERLANNAVEKLKLEGFEAQKFKFNSGDKVLNRVRMGPYETKTDANKFLKWIQESGDFQESYIVETKS